MATTHLLGAFSSFVAIFVLLAPSHGDTTYRTSLGSPRLRLREKLLKIPYAPWPEVLFSIPFNRASSDLVVNTLSSYGICLVQEQALTLLAVLFCVSMFLGIFLASSWLGAAVGAGFFILSFALACSKHEQELSRERMKEMPEVFRTLSVILGSGQTLSQAIEHVGREGQGPISKEFVQAALRLRCGESVEEVVEELGANLKAPGAGLLSFALVISHRTGSPLKKLFKRSAQLIERAGESERLLAVKTAQVRLSVRVVCLLPLVLVALLASVSPDFREGIASATGIASLCIAAVLDLIAVGIIRSLIKGVLT